MTPESKLFCRGVDREGMAHLIPAGEVDCKAKGCGWTRGAEPMTESKPLICEHGRQKAICGECFPTESKPRTPEQIAEAYCAERQRGLPQVLHQREDRPRWHPCQCTEILAALHEAASKDYEDMRRFQREYIRADHERIDLRARVAELERKLAEETERREAAELDFEREHTRCEKAEAEVVRLRSLLEANIPLGHEFVPEAADAPPTDAKVLVEWYRNDAGFHHLVDALASQRLDGARDAARREEREALREWVTALFRPDGDLDTRELRVWLAARSRAEEPR